jgi:predicted nuclease of predicted toxin-antitoxin system
MKIWVDAQLSPAIADWINQTFEHLEAVAIRDVGLRDAEDTVIFFSAREANATVMTKDSDFIELQRKHGSPPKVIWVTCGNTSNTALRKILLANLQKAVELLEGGENLVEITG